MRVTSINTGRAQSIDVGHDPVPSAIIKRPVDGALTVGVDGLAGDEQADTEFHGGPDQAVYVYSVEDYRWWSGQTGRDCYPGLFGENLTIEGLPDDLAVGDRLVIGSSVMEVTGPRLPCSKIAAIMQRPDFVQTFRQAERPGAYLRVLSEGSIRTGDVVSLVPESQVKTTVRELFRLYYDGNTSRETLERVLQAPIGSRIRNRLSKRLA